MEAELSSVDRRVPPDKSVRLTWLGERGQIRCVPGRCIELSSKRIHVEVAVQIPLHAPVMLRAAELGVAGSASVGHVTRCDTRFIVVLDIRD